MKAVTATHSIPPCPPRQRGLGGFHISETETHKYAGEAGEELCSRLLEALAACEDAQRNYYPGIAPELRKRLAPLQERLEDARRSFATPVAPDDQADAGRLRNAAALCSDALRLSTEGEDIEIALVNFQKALRRMSRVQEMIFPLAETIPAVNRFFLEDAVRARAEDYVHARDPLSASGLRHIGLDEHPHARGGCSLYIPESCADKDALPLVMALHGGYGHGRDFIWMWVREARSRRFLLAAPSSRGSTWSLMGQDIDAGLLRGTIRHIADRWPVDRERILLTGISDGATYALIRAMEKESPFTAYAPVAGVLPFFDLRHVEGRRFYWLHGARDWMFPWQRAKEGAERLARAGADVSLRIIPDLYHAYPREQNGGILHWFDPGLDLPAAG